MKLADGLESAIAPFWDFAFSVFGRIGWPKASLWSSPGAQRVLVIAPHPDDEAVGCAGTILLHALAGDTVTLAYVTDGSRSRAGGLNSEQMGLRRREEACQAARALKGSQFEWIGLREGSWSYEEFAPGVLDLFRRFSPQIVYAPSRVDFHPEHHAVARNLARLLSEEGKGFAVTAVRVYQLQVPLTPVLTNLIADCSGVEEESMAVLASYKSQSANMGRALRMWRYAGLCYGMGIHAEEFWQMQVEQYCRLHSGRSGSWYCAGFRGVRYRSFSDPLAYLSGLRMRGRLAKQAGLRDNKC